MSSFKEFFDFSNSNKLPIRKPFIIESASNLLQGLDPRLSSEFNNRLVEISPAAAEAHKKGLRYLGYGKWANQQNQYVAKTVKNKLVFLKPANIGAAKSSMKKPSKTNSANTSKFLSANWKEKVSSEVIQDFEPDTVLMAKKLSGPKGTNPGGFYEDSKGNKRYIKFYNNEAQTLAEFFANHAYNAIGDNMAPYTELTEHHGKLGVATSLVKDGVLLRDYIKNAKTPTDKMIVKDTAKKILNGFAADVLLANWDTIGAELDNIIISPEGQPIRIDNGSTFQFRAQGGIKDGNLNDASREWNGFADPSINPEYARIFELAGYSKPEDIGIPLIKSIERIKESVNSGDLKMRMSRILRWNILNSNADKMIDDYDKILRARTKFLVSKEKDIIRNLVQRKKKISLVGKNHEAQLQLLKENADEFEKIIDAQGLGAEAMSERLISLTGVALAALRKNATVQDKKKWKTVLDMERRMSHNTPNKLLTRGAQIYAESLLKQGITEITLPEIVELVHPNVFVSGEKREYIDFVGREPAEVDNIRSQLLGDHINRDEKKTLFEWSANQNDPVSGWRQQFSTEENQKLFEITNDWRNAGVWENAGSARRRKMFAFINKTIGNAKNPAILSTDKPLERGMKFLEDTPLKLFLKNFKINSTLCLPPAGFSADHAVARDFGNINSSYMRTVILHLHPKDNKIVGMGIFNTQDAARQFYDEHLSSEVEKMRDAVDKLYHDLDNVYSHSDTPSGSEKVLQLRNQINKLTKKINQYRDIRDPNTDYDSELEIIRPGTAMVKVRDIVKKVVRTESGRIKIIYDIIVDEQGITEDPTLIKEAETLNKIKLLVKAMLYKYASGPLRKTSK